MQVPLDCAGTSSQNRVQANRSTSTHPVKADGGSDWRRDHYRESRVANGFWVGRKMASILSTPQIQPELLAQRRLLVIFLPRWATDFLKRRDPGLATSGRPLILYEKHKSAMRIAALDEAASRLGLRLGQALSDARAQLPSIDAREIDHLLLEGAFTDFADWHSYASPMVSVLTDSTPYGDLVLDITGVSHLFGGEEQMLATVTRKLQALGFAVRAAIAPTVGAAWAIAHFGREPVVATGSMAEAIALLPVAALRLADEQVAGLSQLGLKLVGQLYDRDRKALQARLGASLIRRLDQALGYLEERVTPRLPPVERFVERRFADPIGLMDDVLMCAHDLAVSLSVRLENEGIGARSFHLFIYRVDHKVMTLSVNSGRPTRDADHIGRLFTNRAERLQGDYDAGFGIDMVRLAASSVCELEATQVGAFEIDTGAQNLDRLYDRITSRLGPLAVLRPKFIDTHVPEQAVKLEPAIAATDHGVAIQIDLRRPLRLLAQPEPVTIIAQIPDGPPARMTWRRIGYRFVKASGPERIAAEWWTGSQIPILTKATEDFAIKEGLPERYFDEGKVLRDYYVAEDEGGRRFWIFREGLYGNGFDPSWYLHGLFA
jgi:protein ImuB